MQVTKNRLQRLWVDIREAPLFLLHYFIGLVGLPIQQIDFTSLLIFAILVGIATSSVVIGAAVFFGGYVVMRLVDQVAGGLYHIGQR